MDQTGQRKQQLVSDLLADQLTVGRAEITQATDDAVLTLEEAAALLRVDPVTLRDCAARGELPGRAFDGEWRFSRTALLAWLAGDGTGPAPDAGVGGRAGA